VNYVVQEAIVVIRVCCELQTNARCVAGTLVYVKHFLELLSQINIVPPPSAYSLLLNLALNPPPDNVQLIVDVRPQDIFRKYPNRYESIIGLLCENLDTLDEPEAKAAMVWVIGEYSSRIDNADELLEAFAETFLGVWCSAH
jgi:hypothetical protein